MMGKLDRRFRSAVSDIRQSLPGRQFPRGDGHGAKLALRSTKFVAKSSVCVASREEQSVEPKMQLSPRGGECPP